MFDSNGAAVMLPAEAIGLRARFWPDGSRGIGELVEDDDGQPVFIPRNATAEEFRELVGYKPGRYKLIALDRSFQFIERVPLVSTTIKKSTAARAGVRSTTADTSPDTLGQVLAFVKDSHSHALAQIASLQRDMYETQRQTTAQFASIVGASSSLLSAAGTSGLVKKTTVIDAAAAGAPVTVNMGSLAGAGEAPRNGNAPAVAAAAASPASSSGVEAVLSLFAPLIEKAAPVFAYGAAIKMDVPEETARELAGVVRSTVQIAGAMLKPDAAADAATAAAASTSPTVGLASRVGSELMAHVMRIQVGLPEDDRAWVLSTMAKTPGLIDALKPSVAALTVEEGIGAVRMLRVLDSVLTEPNERRLFGLMLTPDVLPSVFRPLLVDRTAEEAIEYMRARAAEMVARG